MSDHYQISSAFDMNSEKNIFYHFSIHIQSNILHSRNYIYCFSQGRPDWKYGYSFKF